MTNKLFAGFIGSPSVLESSENQELVQKGIVFHKFSFFNYTTCTVSINGSDPIYLAAEQGFNSDSSDAKIKSFIIINGGINFNWVGSYRDATIY